MIAFNFYAWQASSPQEALDCDDDACESAVLDEACSCMHAISDQSLPLDVLIILFQDDWMKSSLSCAASAHRQKISRRHIFHAHISHAPQEATSGL